MALANLVLISETCKTNQGQLIPLFLLKVYLRKSRTISYLLHNKPRLPLFLLSVSQIFWWNLTQTWPKVCDLLSLWHGQWENVLFYKIHIILTNSWSKEKGCKYWTWNPSASRLSVKHAVQKLKPLFWFINYCQFPSAVCLFRCNFAY